MNELDDNGIPIKRIGWDEYFLEIAKTVALRSSCYRAQVGAVFVKDNRILTTGYNGAPAGTAHCEHEGDYWDRLHIVREGKHLLNGHCYVAIHAELNAIIQAAIIGISLKDSVVYCTHEPCLDCTKGIIQVGCLGIQWINEYPNKKARELRRAVFGIEI